jgi:hypothetical protein
LDELPEEIVDLIPDCFDGGLIRCQSSHDRWRNYEDFTSLCLTSRKFNRLAKPYFRATMINSPLSDEHTVIDRLVLDSSMSHDIKRICWTVRTSQLKNRYGDAIKPVELKFSQRLGRLGIPELAGDLRRRFKCSEFADRLAVTLILMCNVEYLQVITTHSDYENDITTWLDLLSLSTSSNASGLSEHLRRLYHVRLDMERLSLEQIGPLLRLQSLRILHIENAIQDEVISSAIYFWPTQPNATTSL